MIEDWWRSTAYFQFDNDIEFTFREDVYNEKIY